MTTSKADRGRVRGTRGVWACPVCAARLSCKGIGCFIHHQATYVQSTGEYWRWCDLMLLSEAGIVIDLKRQVSFPIKINDIKVCTYIADFTYQESGSQVVEDFKGYDTDMSKLKRKMVEAQYGIKILITTRGKR